jgi:uncharacterized protein YoxC
MFDSEFWRFCANYFSESPAFYTAHSIIAILAVALFWELERRCRTVSATAAAGRTITETEYEDAVLPLESFQSYFELCAASFIFVGLVGTIYGFAVAIPSLRDPNYNFMGLANALSTSAFGILWSTILSFLVSLHDWYRVQPVKALLREQVEAELLTKALAEVLGQLRDIPSDMREVLKTYDKAGASLREMAEQLAAAGSSATKVFDGLGERAAGLVEQSNGLVRDLQTTMEQFAAAAANLQNLPQGISMSVQAVAQSASAGVSNSLRQSAAAVNESFSAINEKLAEISAIPSALKQSVDATNKEVIRAFEAHARTLNERLETLASRPMTRAAAVHTNSAEIRLVKDDVVVKTRAALPGSPFGLKPSGLSSSRIAAFDRSNETNSPAELAFQRKWYDFVQRPLRWLRRYRNG